MHNLHDLPVVSEENMLVVIASRITVRTAILATWESIKR
jgi:hypothetical protein